MSIVKSLAVGDGDMFYIKHNSDNFTLIDCCMPDDAREKLIEEIKAESEGKGITRFISTHPDQDHLCGLSALDDTMGILNFYCVRNEATKDDPTRDFERYCKLRDDAKKAFYLERECSRHWMNQSNDDRDSSGINILWPVVSNPDYKAALADAKEGESPNNISCIATYSLLNGVTMMWMGDLETDFMEKIEDAVKIKAADILFAPHHGRESGKVPSAWLAAINPKIVVLGEAPSENLNYYAGYNTITQNSAGDITFTCDEGKTHIYVSNEKYSVNFLDDENMSNTYGTYIGTLTI